MPYVVFQISVPIYLPRFMCCNLIGEIEKGYFLPSNFLKNKIGESFG
jgi:hypothetical protein